MGLFQKKKKAGYWYLVDFTEAAKEYAVGNDFCKKVYLMHDKNWTGQSDDYSEAKITRLKANHQIVIDVTVGQMVPRESIMVPRTEAAFGTIQLFKRVY